MSQLESIRPSHLFSRPVVTRLLVTLLLAAILLGAIVAAIVLFDRQHARQIASERGDNALRLEYEFLQQEIESIQSDLAALANQAALQQFVSGNDALRAGIEHDYVQFALSKKTYDQVRFLDLSGSEVIRVNYGDGQPKIATKDQLQSKADRYYFREAQHLKAGEILVSKFDLNIEHGKVERPLKPVIRFVTPVFDDIDRRKGILVLNYLGDRLLKRLADVASGSNGRVMLLNLDGQYIYSDEPANRWGWLLGHDRDFPTHYPNAWSEVGKNTSGQLFAQERLLIFERVHLSTCKQAMHSGENSKGNTTHSGVNSLILVWEILDDEIYAASNNLLGKLLLMYGSTLTVITLLGWYLSYVRIQRSEQQRRIEQSEERLRTLSKALLVAQETERQNISRQLHDELGQQVTAICLDIKSAAKKKDLEQAQSLLDRAIEETESLLQGIHEIAANVRPSVLDDLGFQDAVESFVSSFGQRTGIDVDCDLPSDCNGIPPPIRDNVYRILQESLTNVAKHANTKQAKVHVRINDERLELTVTDEGAGFEVDKQDISRLGILGMRERTELLGGEFALTTSPGNGTSVQVHVPLQTNS